MLITIVLQDWPRTVENDPSNGFGTASSKCGKNVRLIHGLLVYFKLLNFCLFFWGIILKKHPYIKPYSRMTRDQRKVAIAQDVIKQLHVLRIKKSNGYVVPDKDFDLDQLLSFGVTPKQIAQKAMETCTFCARGAMMICKVDKFNNFGFEDLDCLNDISDDTTTEALEDAFTDEELNEIEYCFESSWSNWAEIEDDKDRLQAIMTNIIDHKGVFKPEVEYTVG